MTLTVADTLHFKPGPLRLTVYVVFEDEYEIVDQIYYGVFSTRARAEAFIRESDRDLPDSEDKPPWCIREVVVDADAPYEEVSRA